MTDDLVALTARLDKQARVIRDLRARVIALESAVPTSAFTLPPTCVMCDGEREAGRRTLTCAACSAERNAIIKEGRDREPIMRDSCVCCGTAFPRSTRFLCTPCSAAFKLWKAT